MTGPQAVSAAFLAASSYDLPEEQLVVYTYWPVNYYRGDPHVIGNAPLPLSGVSFSEQMKGVGELRASLQLADADVRAMNPWELILPRKTGLVAVRSVLVDEDTDTWEHSAVWHGVVWERTPAPAAGRWEITARTVEYCWSRRLITGPMAGGDLVWAQADRTEIVQDLLTPELFSQVGPPSTYGTATATTDAASLDRVVVATVDVGDIPAGSYVRVKDLAGIYRTNASATTDIFYVSAVENAGALSAVVVTPLFASLSLTGDTVEVINLWPGWINVDPPTAMTLQVHDFSYKRDQQTNLLTAHQDRSKVSDGYDWHTSVRVLEGATPIDAISFRCQFVMGYPRLGREYGVDEIPRFVFRVSGQGNVIDSTPVYNGEGVANVMWGQGSGYDSDALRAQATNSSDWVNGFLITEDRYSNPDVSRSDTLQAYTIASLLQTYANEQFLDGVTVRGDKPPYFGTYALGDDALFSTDDWTNADGPNGDRDTTYRTRIMGWTVTPPEAGRSETVKLVLAGGGDAVLDG
jgi:hypothetical protein